MEKNIAARTEFRWSLNWKICLFSFLLLPLLIYLGFWQLQRADEKYTLQDLIAEQQELPPLQWPPSATDGAATGTHLYREVQMEGEFAAQRTWLLENKIYQSRVGYEVLTPFILANGEAILVNRGWIEGTGYRDRLPAIPPVEQVTSVSGRLLEPTRNTLLNQVIPGEQWPQPILQIDLQQMQMFVDAPLLPWVLQINSQHPAALTVDWQDVNMPANKHLGYAWQWFSMALALVILTIFANSNLGQVLRRPQQK